MTRSFVGCGVLSSDESNAAVAQFSSCVVEKRRMHEWSDINASKIPDVVKYLLRDFSFRARPEVCRVLKFCYLVVGLPHVSYSRVTFDLSGSPLSEAAFECCLRLVQSCVLSASYEHQLFFTDVTLDAVRCAIADAGVFYVTPGYDVWKNYCDLAVDSFIAGYQKLYCSFLLGRRKASEKYYVDSNKANRLARVNAGASVSETSSNVSAVSKKVKGVASTSKSADKSAGQSVSSKKLKGNKKNRKRSSSEERDPDFTFKI